MTVAFSENTRNEWALSYAALDSELTMTTLYSYLSDLIFSLLGY